MNHKSCDSGINHWDHAAQNGNSDIALEIPPNFTKVKSALLHLKNKRVLNRPDKISSLEFCQEYVNMSLNLLFKRQDILIMNK
jgi:hypothetical protein